MNPSHQISFFLHLSDFVREMTFLPRPSLEAHFSDFTTAIEETSKFSHSGESVTLIFGMEIGAKVLKLIYKLIFGIRSSSHRILIFPQLGLSSSITAVI
jgi:hypothetical protein